MAEAQYTVREVAELLRVCTKTVYRLIADGALQRTDVGRLGKARTRISESAYRKYIASREGTTRRRSA